MCGEEVKISATYNYKVLTFILCVVLGCWLAITLKLFFEGHPTWPMATLVAIPLIGVAVLRDKLFSS